MKEPGSFIGVISDTHGLLRQDVLDHLTGAELIIHAGDYGSQSILDKLALMSSLMVIRGNVDFDRNIPKTEIFKHRNKTFYVLHNVEDLDVSPSAAGVDYVVFGHTHMPDLKTRSGVNYLNPGSCGPERRGKPVSMAKIFPDDNWRIDFISLDPDSYH